MKRIGGIVRLAATDVSNHLDCAHLTAANLAVTLGEAQAPPLRAPDLWVLQQRGLAHERAYVRFLCEKGLRSADLSEIDEEAVCVAETVRHMHEGANLIVQGALAGGDWFGRPDLLRRVDRRSRLGDWSYEPYDCKLAQETKASTVLQLAQYAALLEAVQEMVPEFMHVVPPSDDFHAETYRVVEYAAYHRSVRRRLENAVRERPTTYPEPNDHCGVCRWWTACDRQWRRDDHLSLVAGISRLQRKQLLEWETVTMEALARLPIPISLTPRHGSKAGFMRVREQARVQVEARNEGGIVFELLSIEPGRGLCRLPEPSDGDIFFDLESDPFADTHGREYLFGFVVATGRGGFEYRRRWALTANEEREAFEWFVDFAMERRRQFPNLHVYHFGHKESSTLKALMGRHATREDEIDRLLRGGMLVDLHAVLRQSVRASVEHYSLKALEEFHGFGRSIPLEDARAAMRQVEHGLQLERPERIGVDIRNQVEAYNSDDCYSTRSLRDWLEGLRSGQIADGTEIERPVPGGDEPTQELGERLAKVANLIADLTSGIPAEAGMRTPEQSARWLLANLLDWHRREAKAAWWEKYRLRDLSDEELRDERAAIAGLEYRRTIQPEGRRRLPTDEYDFPAQETSLTPGDNLYHQDSKIGTVDFIDPARRLLGIRKTKGTLKTHPSAVYSYEVVGSEELAGSLYRFGDWVRDHGLEALSPYRSACDLLLRRPPRLASGGNRLVGFGESVADAAKRLAVGLDDSVLAIQGPPGSGKTYTGARMIIEAIRNRMRVGVAAGSHAVIRKLLEEVHLAGVEAGVMITCLHKVSDVSDGELPDWLMETTKNDEALGALQLHTYSVVAGTAWLWSREEMRGAADILFVDEAGQVSLANALAVAPAARNLVLLGDPQQLDQPLRGSHPDGAEASALEHLLEGAKTIPKDRGLFLDRTWRLHPEICRFTSEAFYESRLEPRVGLENQRIDGHSWLGPAGLWYVPVMHEGNQNSSLEEVERIADIADGLLRPPSHWVNEKGERRGLRAEDILIVAPYNAQVAALSARLPGFRVGTVDKFQGQQAPVVIYSMATSSPEEAPRGMEFLYSLNRLNVATSRAQAVVVLVACPRLLEPACRSPRQMQLANALCRFVEMAHAVDSSMAMGAT